MRVPVCQYDFTDADLRGHGCALATGTWLARETTNGDATEGHTPTAYATRLRELAGMTLTEFRARGTTMTELERAYEAAPGFVGRLGPSMRLMRGVNVRDQLLPLLRDGRYASVAVNYGVIQDAGKGIGSFRGGHNVAITEPEDGRVAVIDPLRRAIVRWDLDLLVKAMETFGTNPWLNGRGEAGVVEYAPTYREAYLDAKSEIADLETVLAKRTEQRDAQKAQTALALDERDAARRELATALQGLIDANELLSQAKAAQERLLARIAELENRPVTCEECETEVARLTAVVDAIKAAVA